MSRNVLIYVAKMFPCFLNPSSVLPPISPFLSLSSKPLLPFPSFPFPASRHLSLPLPLVPDFHCCIQSPASISLSPAPPFYLFTHPLLSLRFRSKPLVAVRPAPPFAPPSPPGSRCFSLRPSPAPLPFSPSGLAPKPPFSSPLPAPPFPPLSPLRSRSPFRLFAPLPLPLLSPQAMAPGPPSVSSRPILQAMAGCRGGEGVGSGTTRSNGRHDREGKGRGAGSMGRKAGERRKGEQGDGDTKVGGEQWKLGMVGRGKERRRLAGEGKKGRDRRKNKRMKGGSKK